MRAKHKVCNFDPGCYPPDEVLRMARVKRRGAAIWYGLGDMARARAGARESLRLRLYAAVLLQGAA